VREGSRRPAVESTFQTLMRQAPNGMAPAWPCKGVVPLGTPLHLHHHVVADFTSTGYSYPCTLTPGVVLWGCGTGLGLVGPRALPSTHHHSSPSFGVAAKGCIITPTTKRTMWEASFLFQLWNIINLFSPSGVSDWLWVGRRGARDFILFGVFMVHTARPFDITPDDHCP
jgi:hypothetical protein